MEHCPLCGVKANIELPEWSGGVYWIKCAGCGEFSTNKITIDALDVLRAAGSPRIGQLQDSIAVNDHPLYLTVHKRFGIVLGREPAPNLTKKQKKFRRRSTPVYAGTITSVTSVSGRDPDEKA